MIQLNDKEWKCYKFGKGFDDSYRLYFSIYGEVMSFSKINPKGKLIRGSLQEGYPIISFSQLSPISEETKDAFAQQELEISEQRGKLRELKKFAKRATATEREVAKAMRQIETEEKTLKKMLDKLSRQRKKDNKKRKIYYHLLVHKAIAELFIPNDDPENKKFVIHKNFDKKDNRIQNLAWATREEVVERSFKSPNYINFKINNPKKDPNATAKLSYNDVVFIKRKLNKGEPMARLARRFGVSDMQIYRIKTGENWGDVKVSLKNEGTTQIHSTLD